MRKKLSMVLTAAMLAGIMAGCSDSAADSSKVSAESSDESKTASAASSTDDKEVYEIGICCANFETPKQVAWMNAATEALDAYGNYKVDQQDGKDDPATQTQIIENFITQKKDMVIVAPTQTDALVAAVKECNEAGIPVITVNRTLGERAEVLTEVNMDCVEAGRMSAQMVEKLLGGEGKVAYLIGTLGAGPQIQESEGFYKYLEDKPEIEVVFEQTTEWNKETAIQVVENMLQKFPAGEIDAIVCQGPDDAVGAVAACEAAGRTELLGKIIAFDYPSYVKEAIEAGTVYGTINQDPRLQGVLAAEVANEYFSNADAEFGALSSIELSVVTKENADDYEVAW